MKRLFLFLMAFVPYFCHAENVVTKMFPADGATDVNIDTHLILTMTEDVTVGQRGFISVYDRKQGNWLTVWT